MGEASLQLHWMEFFPVPHQTHQSFIHYLSPFVLSSGRGALYAVSGYNTRRSHLPGQTFMDPGGFLGVSRCRHCLGISLLHSVR